MYLKCKSEISFFSSVSALESSWILTSSTILWSAESFLDFMSLFFVLTCDVNGWTFLYIRAFSKRRCRHISRIVKANRMHLRATAKGLNTFERFQFGFLINVQQILRLIVDFIHLKVFKKCEYHQKYKKIISQPPIDNNVFTTYVLLLPITLWSEQLQRRSIVQLIGSASRLLLKAALECTTNTTANCCWKTHRLWTCKRGNYKSVPPCLKANNGTTN